ncbi:hypothetical protein K1T71_004397 [Dendrolimus kikuchii]|uniref:Uncharacterized protein n=1 Tax=Dendrolimus kikuchii TaxID=765133 RepID=A0ACC1D815_9NEOP|nr:hypothetical protein K1T71_004397 [Dendrolimus kikuchii]
MYIYLLLIIIFTQFIYAFNNDNGCGCSVSRNHIPKSGKQNIFSLMEKIEQCPISDSNISKKKAYQSSETPFGMVLIPSDTYQVGTNDVIIETDKEGPQRIVEIKSFYIDKYEVSNKDFSRFVSLVNYKTEAELFGDSFVFAIFLNNTFKEKLKDFRVVQATWWYKVDGANWKHPNGPDCDLKNLMDHPVVHVSWNDAREYCKWRGARLPTEAEWEAACRGGHKDTKYPWGNKLFPNKTYMANIWQGTFPHHNSAKDGYVGTNPVELFPQNDFGLYNMAGNVWEWTEDTWSQDTPKEKVKKGGSYLCHHSYCYRYRCSARSHNTDDSTAGNLGFRCAKSL